MKILSYILILCFGIVLMNMFSCNKDKNEFGADTFNLDTIIVAPSTNIDTSFSIGWGVTTVGFPTFFVDMYLSDDNQIDNTDLRISTTSSVDAFTELNKLDEAQFYRINAGVGTGKVVFLHNEKSPDPNATGWTQSSEVNNPSGTAKFIIGRFYNIAGSQIQYKRNQLAVPVSFK